MPVLSGPRERPAMVFDADLMVGTDAEGVSLAPKLTPAEARVDWTQQASEVDRLIRGLSPYPGAWCMAAGERLKLLRSRAVSTSGAPGRVLATATTCLPVVASRMTLLIRMR